jgi:ketosteroid isomerase-like protein
MSQENVEIVSPENVEIVRRFLQAFDNDTDTFRELLHPDIEWMPFEDNNTPSRGLDGVMRIRNGWLDAWEEHSIAADETRDGGDGDVFGAATLIGRGKTSGVRVEVRLYGHFKVRDGKVVYVYEYQDRSEALKAAGLSE